MKVGGASGLYLRKRILFAEFFLGRDPRWGIARRQKLS